MKSIIFFILPLSWLSGCFHDVVTDSMLDREYDVVMAVLTPDSAKGFLRAFPVEVFVGRMIPVNQNNRFEVKGFENPDLHRLVLCTRQHYFCKYEYYDDARVEIETEGQKILLEGVGNGVYRDIGNTLHVRSNQTYFLNVVMEDGRTISSSTRVPDDIEILEPKADTIYDHILDDDIGDTVLVRWTSNRKPFYWNDISGGISVYEFDTVTTPWNPYVDNKDTLKYVDFPIEVRAINADLGHFYAPCEAYSESLEFWDFEKTLYTGAIRSRSNITGKDVVGVFGAYNLTRQHHVIIPVWKTSKVMGRNQRK
jgi:hypothetical protein